MLVADPLHRWWSEEFKSYEYLLDTFYDLGGRHFLLQSVPPIERSPKFLYSNEETRHGVAEAVLRFNKELRNLEVRFKCKHKDVRIISSLAPSLLLRTC